MTWEQWLGALVMALVFARLVWMLAHPTHCRVGTAHVR